MFLLLLPLCQLYLHFLAPQFYYLLSVCSTDQGQVSFFGHLVYAYLNRLILHVAIIIFQFYLWFVATYYILIPVVCNHFQAQIILEQIFRISLFVFYFIYLKKFGLEVSWTKIVAKTAARILIQIRLNLMRDRKYLRFFFRHLFSFHFVSFLQSSFVLSLLYTTE